MRFDLLKINGILGLYALGFSVPCYIGFMVLSLEEDPGASFILAIIGAVALICGVILMWMNNKDTDVMQANPHSSLIQILFSGTILINMLLIIIGMISTI